MRSDAVAAELSAAGVEHTIVATERARSVEESARFQGVTPDRLLKSLLVRRGADDFIFVLMPGPRQMSWTKLRGHLGVSRVSMPSAEEAYEVTGYERGAITPLGLGERLPVIVDAAAPEGTVALGGGAHGVNVHIDRDVLVRCLDADLVDVS